MACSCTFPAGICEFDGVNPVYIFRDPRRASGPAGAVRPAPTSKARTNDTCAGHSRRPGARSVSVRPRPPGWPTAGSAALTSAAGRSGARTPGAPRAAPAPGASHGLSPALSAREQSELVKTYCATCHSERAKAGGLSLAGFDAMKAHEQQDVVEKMIRKLSAGLMPPPGAKKPEAAQLAALTTSLESAHGRVRGGQSQPGPAHVPAPEPARIRARHRRPAGLDVDAANWLPLDQKSANFDNIADEQGLSPTLLEAYLNAAGDISRMAVGDRQAARVDQVYTNPSYVSQHPWDHVEGAPYGTRGGMVRQPRVPGRRRVRVRAAGHLGRQRPRRGHRRVDRRPARGAHQVRERAGGGGRRPRRLPVPHRSDPGRAPASTRWRRRSSNAPTARTRI